MEEVNQTQTSKSFTSKQSLSSSIKKSEKALPFSPRKKKDVISGLAERYKLRRKYVERRGRKAHTLTEEQQKWLDDAFDRPDITYVNPGRLRGEEGWGTVKFAEAMMGILTK